MLQARFEPTKKANSKNNVDCNKNFDIIQSARFVNLKYVQLLSNNAFQIGKNDQSLGGMEKLTR